jgi:hypothetical protein
LFLYVTGLNQRAFGMLLKHVINLEEFIRRRCGRQMARTTTTTGEDGNNNGQG